MRILITGHQGFIGRHVSKLLSSCGHIVIPCTIPFDYKISDILKNEIMRADAIIHLAGRNRASDYELYTTNVLLTAFLLDAINTYNPKCHIVFASSFQVLYDTSLYGASKKACEELLVVYSKRNQIKTTTLRLANVYGPGCKPFYNSVIATYIYQAMHNQPLQVNNDGSQQRDFVYVDDVAKAFLAAVIRKNPIEQTEYNTVYTICSGKQVPLNDIITHIRQISGEKITIQQTNNPEPNPLPIFLADKAEDELHWKPIVSLQDGIQKIITEDYEHTSTHP